MRAAQGTRGKEGVGRPPEYCDDPAHNRGSAWRARRATAAAAGEGAANGERVRSAGAPSRRGSGAGRPPRRPGHRVGHGIDGSARLVLEELRNLGDRKITALQTDAVTAEADERSPRRQHRLREPRRTAGSLVDGVMRT